MSKRESSKVVMRFGAMHDSVTLNGQTYDRSTMNAIQKRRLSKDVLDTLEPADVHNVEKSRRMLRRQYKNRKDAE